MTHRTPLIVGDTLSIQKSETVQSMVVGTAEWFVWLETATVFTYREDGAIFTAQKRTRKGRYYWYGYARRAGHLHCVYLGRAADLTIERLHATMNRLYPIDDSPTLSCAAERYGQRSAQGMHAQRQFAGLYSMDASSQQQLDLVKVKKQLQLLGELLPSDRGRVASASHHVLAIAHALVLTCEQLRDTNARDMAIIQRLLRDAQERIWGYQALLQQHGGGEVF